VSPAGVHKPGVRRGLVVFLAFFVLLNTLLLTEIGLYQRNTIDHNPRWFLGKTLMQRQPFGAIECLITRNLLARNRLNLSVWHGCQEVLLTRVAHLEKARFRFRLQENAYVVVVWRKTKEGWTGLRMSRRADLPSIVFHADLTERFTEQRPVAGLQTAGWHQAELTPGRLVLDGGPPISVPELTAGEGLFGFRGSYLPAEVDDVELWEGGRQTMAEGFRNADHYWPVFLQCFGLIGLLTLLVALLKARERLLWCVLANLTGCAVLCVSWLFDYGVYSARYCFYEKQEDLRRRVSQRLFAGPDPLPERDLLTVPRFLDLPKFPKPSSYRIQIHRDGQDLVIRDSLEDLQHYRQAYPQPPRTILFLGTSQTWGEGAHRMDAGMVSHVARAFPDVEIINAARQGSNSNELQSRYETHLRTLAPQLVVVNLGSNDEDTNVLEANLNRLWSMWCQPVGTKLLLVLEANSPENPPDKAPYLEKKHAKMREVARKLGLPVVDLHSHMREQLPTGFLWWDFVHPTSHGHRVAGEFLVESIRQEYPLPAGE